MVQAGLPVATQHDYLHDYNYYLFFDSRCPNLDITNFRDVTVTGRDLGVWDIRVQVGSGNNMNYVEILSAGCRIFTEVFVLDDFGRILSHSNQHRTFSATPKFTIIDRLRDQTIRCATNALIRPPISLTERYNDSPQHLTPKEQGFRCYSERATPQTPTVRVFKSIRWQADKSICNIGLETVLESNLTDNSVRQITCTTWFYLFR